MVDTPRDAVIILSGLHREDIGESVDEAAIRFADALENEAKTVAAKFLLEEGREEDYGKAPNTYKTRRVTVSRQEPGGRAKPKKLVDLYGLDWRDTLIGDLKGKRPVMHLLSTFIILASNARRLLFSIGRMNQVAAKKWQVRLGWFLYCVLFLYFLSILGAFIGSLAEISGSGSFGTTPQQQVGAPASEGQLQKKPIDQTLPRSGSVEKAKKEMTEEKAADLANEIARRATQVLAPAGKIMQWLVVWVTAIGLFSKLDLKAWVEKTGLGITATSEYLTFDNQRQALASQFAALLNHIGEKTDVKYDRIHIIGYSFGSVVAIDALYPYNQPAEVFRQVKSLVTIGCPFDFIQTYWPDYFSNRAPLEGVPQHWINIYSPADVLASDFTQQRRRRWWDAKARDDSRIETGITLTDRSLKRPERNELFGRPDRLDQYSVVDKLSFVGFRMHKSYWEEGAAGCYRIVVRGLFENTEILT